MKCPECRTSKFKRVSSYSSSSELEIIYKCGYCGYEHTQEYEDVFNFMEAI